MPSQSDNRGVTLSPDARSGFAVAAAATWEVEEHPYAQIPHALIEDIVLPHTAVRVYCYLMRRAKNDTREAFPGLRLIGKEIGMSTGTVAKGIAALEDCGWIDVTRSWTKKGERTVNHYFVRRTRRGVSENETPVPDFETGGVSEFATELEPSLTTTRELSLAPSAPDDLAFIDTSGVCLTKGEYHTAMKDALVEAMGWDVAEVPKAQWGRVEAAAKMLTDIKAAPADVWFRAQVYRVNFAGATMTPNAIATNWADLKTPREPIPARQVKRAAARASSRAAIATLKESE